MDYQLDASDNAPIDRTSSYKLATGHESSVDSMSRTLAVQSPGQESTGVQDIQPVVEDDGHAGSRLQPIDLDDVSNANGSTADIISGQISSPAKRTGASPSPSQASYDEGVSSSPEPNSPSKDKRHASKGKGKRKKDEDKEEAIEDEAKHSVIEEHTMSSEEVANKFKDSNISPNKPSGSKGLSTARAKELLEQNGPNRLTPPKRVSMCTLYWRQYNNLFNILLLIAALLCLITFAIDTDLQDNLYVAIVLFVIIFLQTFLSFLQERKTARLQDAFTAFIPTKSNVIRDGKEANIATSDLVVGDIVLISEGDKIPADLRLLEVSDLKVEQAALTGESEPVSRSEEAEPTDTIVTEASCIAFNGTLVTQGSGVGVVVATGDETFIGRIAGLTSRTETGLTTLEREVNLFVRFIAYLAIAMATVFFAIGLGRKEGDDVLSTFVSGFIVIIVANVPQGLPATVTSLLTIATKRLASRNIFVKKLNYVETLGAATVICSDKTGTLTKNEMTVTELWLDRDFFWQEFSELLDRKRSKSTANQGSDANVPNTFDMFHLVSSVCNKAFIERAEDSASNNQPMLGSHPLSHDSSSHYPSASDPRYQRSGSHASGGQSRHASNAAGHHSRTEFGGQEDQYFGSPSEVALLRFCNGLRSIQRVRDANNVVFEIPFNSRNKWHLVIVKQPTEDGYTVLMKGAPEIMLSKCSTYLFRGQTRQIDEDFKDAFMSAYNRFGASGRRVLGFAYKHFQASDDVKFNEEANNFPTSDLHFVGLSAIMDPPKEGVRDAIEACHTASVKVFMVTGDHPLTAEAIAIQVGILPKRAAKRESDSSEGVSPAQDSINPNRLRVIKGPDVSKLTAEDWRLILSRDMGTVFARTTPQDKLYIVRKCKEFGQVVAVTGDGVNDAPALKQADIGVAMGIQGSEVAKEAADVVLMDDNFASIVRAIEEGRLVFDNLKKTIAYTLAHLLPEILPVLLTLALGLPAGLTTLQILSIDLFTELAPAISLAYEPAERDIMLRPPRNIATDRLVSAKLLIYAYLQAGVILSIGCFLAYSWVFWSNGLSLSDLVFEDDDFAEGDDDFEGIGPDRQDTILQRARAAWYLTLVIGQLFHLLNLRSIKTSIFKHSWDNSITYFALALTTSLAILFVYVPGLNDFLGAAPVGEQGWVPPIVVGVILTIYNETRAYMARNKPENRCTHAVNW